MEKYKRREQRLETKKRMIPKHGRNIGEVYKNALDKRTSKEDR